MSINVIPMPNKIDYHGGECYPEENELIYETDSSLDEEAYKIEISLGKTIITSSGERGSYYARLTLEQLRAMGRVPLCTITDSPAYSYRGFMIDSSRHMQTLEEIKAYIEAAARYKMNVFHWHLCDDQGWRIESEKHPKLNEVGSYRNGHGFGSENMSVYGGYYTKKQIREIIDFCKERYIEVIPEIDMPGHTCAILATYPELSCREKPVEVQTTGGIFRDILCAGKEEVFSFCFDILQEVCELFDSEYIHIGGDEAPKARWCECEKCQQRIKDEGLKSEEELQGYFANRIIAFLREKGKKTLAWNESLNSGILDNSTIICQWMDPKHKSQEYANKGGKIIAEDFYHYYLDYEYGMTPLSKTYSYNPVTEELDSVGRQNILGVETPVWTEFIEDFDRMSYMCFPRLIAVAETGWTRLQSKDYESFKDRVQSNREYLLSLGIKMADRSSWDPGILIRARVMLKRLRSILTPSAISVALFPNRNED